MIRALVDALPPALLLLAVYAALITGNAAAAVVFGLAFLWLAVHSAAGSICPDDDQA